MTYKITILLLPIIFLLGSCSLFSDTLKVEVPKGFVGWCYVIPLSSKKVSASPVVDGKYQVDTNGVVLIPAYVFDVRKSHVLKVYEESVDISNDNRYAGSVYRTKSTDSIKYNYIHFYLPSLKERSIPDGEEYWREKMDKYYQSMKFDSLLQVRKIVF
jgi:hypothetical protein